MLKVLSIFLLMSFSAACPDKDPLCLLCLNDQCEICASGFKSGKVCQMPVKKISNCLSYLSENQCDVCQLGYYLDDKKTCHKIDLKHCLSIDQDGYCVACDNNLLISENDCKTTKTCSDKNCDVCGVDEKGKESCMLCKQGFVLRRSVEITSCVTETASTKNCMVVTPNDNEKCLVCRYNYFFVKDSCSKAVSYSLAVKAEQKIFETVVALFAIFAISI